MKPLDQNEAVFVGPNQNRILLPDFQNAFRDFLGQLGFKRLPPLQERKSCRSGSFPV